MIKIEVLKNSDIKKISISGHANYDVYGQDIVCAAVSSIVTTSINGILCFKKTIEVSDNGKLLEIKVLENDEITNKLLFNMLSLLEGIEKQYKNNLKIKTKEKNIW